MAPKSRFDVRSPKRTYRKVCDKCGRASWVKRNDRRCHRLVEAVRGLNKPEMFYCYGTLSTPKRAPASDLTTVANRKRREAATQQRRAATRVKALQTRIKRLQTALRKQQKRVVHYGRLAQRSDEEIAVARERIKTARMVQTVRRRLLKSAGVTLPNNNNEDGGL